MSAPNPDYLALLRALQDHGVEFIVVGGVCAVLHGAPIATFDLDVVHLRSPENVERILKLLDTLKATSRVHPGRGTRPDTTHLLSPGHQLLMTECGPLDLLGSLGGGETYEDLLPHTTEIDLEGGLGVRLLDLETLVRLKEASTQEKDRAVLPILRRILRERERA